MLPPFHAPPAQEFASVTTEPTPAGEAALDPFHPLGPVKRLRHKLLRAFEGTDQFLRVLQVRLAALCLALPACLVITAVVEHRV